MSSAFCGLPRKFAATVPLAIFVVNGWRGTADYANPLLTPNRLVDCASVHKITDMAGQGSAGNVVAALCSFFIPGLGQLLQGRLLMAIVQFCLAAILWFVLLGWIIHLWSILDAALFKPGK